MRNQGLGPWMLRRAERSGRHLAVIDGERRLTWHELAEQTAREATALHEEGIGPGDRVAYLGENSVEFLRTIFAVWLVGGVLVPLNTRLAAPEVTFQLDDSGARLLLHDQVLEALAAESCPTGTVSRRAVGEAGAADAAPRRAARDEGVEPWREDVAVAEDETAMILYTSGTTGRPKGARLTHRNLTWNCINALVDSDVRGDDVCLMISPMFHVASLGMGVLPAVLKGAALVLEARFDPGRALELIERERVTSLAGVPTTFQMLMEHDDWERRDLGSLRRMSCGGSAVPRPVLDAYESRGVAFTMNYGMTEASPGVTMSPPERTREKAGSSGLPHFFTEVRIVDPLGEELGPGETGEILVSGPQVITDYWNRPDAGSAFRDGWFHTGDVGHLDEDGFLYVTDRLKDMFVSGGENVYPAEVESVLSEHPAVSSVAVVGVPDDRWGEVPHAYIVAVEGRSITEQEVMSFLDGRLARYKIPRHVTLVDDLPRTASGKLRKSQLVGRRPSA